MAPPLKSFLIHTTSWLVAIVITIAWFALTLRFLLVPLTVATAFLIWFDRRFIEAWDDKYWRTPRSRRSDTHYVCWHPAWISVLLLVGAAFFIPWYIASLMQSLWLYGKFHPPRELGGSDTNQLGQGLVQPWKRGRWGI